MLKLSIKITDGVEFVKKENPEKIHNVLMSNTDTTTGSEIRTWELCYWKPSFNQLNINIPVIITIIIITIIIIIITTIIIITISSSNVSSSSFNSNSSSSRISGSIFYRCV